MKKTKNFLVVFIVAIMLLISQVQPALAVPRVSSKSRPNLSITPKSASTISLKWKEFGDADGYMIYRKTSKSGKWKKIKTTTAISYTNKSLKLNKKYYYRIKAYAKLGGKKVYSPYSNTKSASPRISKPTIKITENYNYIKISIKKPSCSQGVIIYRKASKTGKWIKLKRTTSKSYIDKEIKSQKTYYYRAKAYKKIDKKYYYSDYTSTLPCSSNTIIIKKGNSISQSIHIDGKKITMAITEESQYDTASFKNALTAFKRKYNCDVQLKMLKFSTYNQQVAQAKSAGNMYDICYIHGSMFPGCAIDGLYEPLNNTLRSGDVQTDSKSGGIDLNKTSYFVFKGKIYGTCNLNSAFPYIIYYNKRLFDDNGLSDPRELAEKGKWTWSVIQQMGRKVTTASSNVYFLSNSFSAGRAIQLSYGAPIVACDGKGGYTQNVTSVNYINACKFIQQICVGKNAITEPTDSLHSDSYSNFFHYGKTFMYISDTSNYTDIKKYNRIGINIVEVPLGGTNKDHYPTSWLTAVACGKGKDPRVAIAWDVFRSRYSTNSDMRVTDQEYTNNLITGNIVFEPAYFANTKTSTLNIASNKIMPAIRNGADVSKTVTDYKDQINNCIKYTLHN